MSAVYFSRHKAKNARLLDCPSATLFFHASRVLADVHWDWKDSAECYETHRWTKDGWKIDTRPWPGDTALASFLAGVRGDDRLAGDPLFRLLALYITVEYLTALL